MKSERVVKVEIKILESADTPLWDTYVYNHPKANLYHLSGWHEVIQRAYGHHPYYLIAMKDQYPSKNENAQLRKIEERPVTALKREEMPVVGILPLIHLRHFIFGNRLVSMPYFDLGGILADDEETERALLSEAIKLGKKLRVKSIELRHLNPLQCLIRLNSINSMNSTNPINPTNSSNPSNSMNCVTKTHKVRMVLELPGSADALLKSFKAKLRSQIMKPTKDGLKAKIGGIELLDEFYQVFSINMRDLGSPVHSMRLMEEVVNGFGSPSKIIVIHKENRPLACSLVVGFKDTLENPWASALREYSRLSPNMLLYWTMLEYACGEGYRFFDFGRSTPDEGTYQFKEQWGATPQPLNWQTLTLNGKPIDGDQSERSGFDRAIEYWKKLPVPVTRVVGPMIRKHISL